MTRISEIHGIGQDEFAQRGQEVTESGFLPYLSLTTGETRLMLALQRAKIYAQFYRDVPQYREAVTMLENALNRGLSNGVNFVGAVPDYLQDVARVIQSASRQTAPASRSGFMFRPGGVMRGIGEIIPAQQRKDICVKKVIEKGGGAGAVKKGVEACSRQFEIERIFNGAIEKSGHHVLYHRIPESAKMPDRVFTKLLLQLGGVQGMAGVGDIQKPLMAEWVENGIIGKNAQIGVGPWDSIRASVALSPDPDKYFKKFVGTSSDKWRAGVTGIGNPAAVLILGAIASALVAAKDLINSLRTQQAVIKSEGFGTDAFSGKQTDWDGPDTAGGLDTNTLLMLAAGVGLLLYVSSD